MSCLSCENYIPLDPPIQRTDSNGQTYKVPGLCKIGADHIISGFLSIFQRQNVIK